MRLIDADRLEDRFKHMPELVYTDVIARAIRDEPTVDAVQVVRCRDCKRWRYIGVFREKVFGKCGKMDVISKPFIEQKLQREDWFCAYGEKA